MPTYNYRCRACGHEFEKFHKITAKSRPRCPTCGKTVERVITGGAGLHFKGSGFYITDYKKSSRSEAAPEGQQGQEGRKEQKEQKGQEGGQRQKGDQPAPKKTGDEH